MCLFSQIAAINRDAAIPDNVVVAFGIIQNGKPIPAVTVIAKLAKLTLTEFDEILEYTVN